MRDSRLLCGSSRGASIFAAITPCLVLLLLIGSADGSPILTAPYHGSLTLSSSPSTLNCGSHHGSGGFNFTAGTGEIRSSVRDHSCSTSASPAYKGETIVQLSETMVLSLNINARAGIRNVTANLSLNDSLMGTISINGTCPHGKVDQSTTRVRTRGSTDWNNTTYQSGGCSAQVYWQEEITSSVVDRTNGTATAGSGQALYNSLLATNGTYWSCYQNTLLLANGTKSVTSGCPIKSNSSYWRTFFPYVTTPINSLPFSMSIVNSTGQYAELSVDGVQFVPGHHYSLVLSFFAYSYVLLNRWTLATAAASTDFSPTGPGLTVQAIGIT